MSLVNEVKRLIKQPKGVSLEYEALLPTSLELAEVIGALANTQGGHIILGVAAMGMIEGLSPEMKVQEVMDRVPDHLDPLPQFTHQFVTVEGKQVYAIEVLQSIKEIFVKGRRFIRKGEKTIVQTLSQSVNDLPSFFVDALKEQVTEQYQNVLRYRKLKNDITDPIKRKAHQKEIDRCLQNIQEIQKDFLQQAKQQNNTLSTNHLLHFSQQVVTQVIQELDREYEANSTVQVETIQKTASKSSPTIVTIQETTSKNQAVIFTGFANPHGDLANLSKEQHGIQDALSALEGQGKLQKLLQRTDLRLSKYFDMLRTWENKINIFHFGGHANSQDIRLQDRSIFFEPLAQELKLRNPDSLQLVFLNGCATQAHVQTLFDLDFKGVIATSVSIADNLAAMFAIRFYENLAKGDTIEKAFKSARNYAEARQKTEQKYRIFEQPVDWASRGSVKLSRTDQENESFPWGLYVNDDEVQNYRLVGD